MSKELDNIMEFEDLEDLVHEYDIRVCKIFDQHAPLKTKKVTIRNEIPCFTNDALKLKIQTRNAERHWKKHKTLENWLEFCRNHEVLMDLCISHAILARWDVSMRKTISWAMLKTTVLYGSYKAGGREAEKEYHLPTISQP